MSLPEHIQASIDVKIDEVSNVHRATKWEAAGRKAKMLISVHSFELLAEHFECTNRASLIDKLRDILLGL